jgi:hypothetical protein
VIAEALLVEAFAQTAVPDYLGVAEKERKADTLRFLDQRSIFRCKI